MRRANRPPHLIGLLHPSSLGLGFRSEELRLLRGSRRHVNDLTGRIHPAALLLVEGDELLDLELLRLLVFNQQPSKLAHRLFTNPAQG